MSRTKSSPKIRIATRNSPLALWQAKYIQARLQNAHANLIVEIVGMTTRGDQLLDQSLATLGGKGLFLKELEISLLNNETDIAVHSMKDVPAELPEGLDLAVVCEREDPSDAYVSNKYANLEDLPSGACVGTASLRRVSQLRHVFPHLEFKVLRGNVNTRLAKLDANHYDGIILATAGLVRLGFAKRIRQKLLPELCLPAVGQGIVGVECRDHDEATKALLTPLHNTDSYLVLMAERAMSAALDGGCSVPVAGYAELVNGGITMRGLVASLDGERVLTSSQYCETADVKNAIELGQEVAHDLLRQGARDLLLAAREEVVAGGLK